MNPCGSPIVIKFGVRLDSMVPSPRSLPTDKILGPPQTIGFLPLLPPPHTHTQLLAESEAELQSLWKEQKRELRTTLWQSEQGHSLETQQPIKPHD